MTEKPRNESADFEHGGANKLVEGNVAAFMEVLVNNNESFGGNAGNTADGRTCMALNFFFDARSGHIVGFSNFFDEELRHKIPEEDLPFISEGTFRVAIPNLRKLLDQPEEVVGVFSSFADNGDKIHPAILETMRVANQRIARKFNALLDGDKLKKRK